MNFTAVSVSGGNSDKMTAQNDSLRGTCGWVGIKPVPDTQTHHLSHARRGWWNSTKLSNCIRNKNKLSNSCVVLPEIQIRAHNTGILDILRCRAECQINSHLYSGSKATGFFCGHHRFSPNEECKIWCCLSPKTFCTINTWATIFGAETVPQSTSELDEAKWTPLLKQSEEELAVSH